MSEKKIKRDWMFKYNLFYSTKHVNDVENVSELDKTYPLPHITSDVEKSIVDEIEHNFERLSTLGVDE